jgi:hypothetical protein
VAIAFRSKASVTNTTRTNTTISAPAGAVNGSDVLVAALDVGNTASVTISTPAGWTQVSTVQYTKADPWIVNVYLFMRVHDGSSTFTFNHASGSSEGVIEAWSGVDNTTPSDATPATATGTAVTATIPSITIVTAGAQEVVARGAWDGLAISPPAGWTEQLDQAVLWVGDFPAVGAGSTGTTSLASGNSGPSLPWGIIHAALRPASGGAPAIPPFLTMQTRRAY